MYSHRTQLGRKIDLILSSGHRPPVPRVPLYALALSIFAPEALAQQVAEAPPKTQDIKAVERGFFLETDVGVNLMLTKMEDRAYGLGIHTGVFAGYDILPFLSISAGALGVSAPGSDDNAIKGDLFFILPMVRAQIAFLTTERDFVYARAGVGFGFGLPEQIGNTEFGGNGVAFSAVLGYEHYTKLRHFSIGATAGVLGVTKPGFGLGVSIVPTLKYTF